MGPARRGLMGLLVAAAVLLLAEVVVRLVAGPPLPPVVMRMPDGKQGLFDEVGGELRPRLEQHQRWWPTGPKQAGRPRVAWLGSSSLECRPSHRHKAALRVGEALGLETVNLAVGGMDTAHLVAELPGVLALEPDLVVIYEGHNDLGNALFTQRYADPRQVRIARTRQVLTHSRVYELLEMGWRKAEERDAIIWFDKLEGSLDAEARALVLRDYEERLDGIVATLRGAGVPVVLSTVVSNAFFPSALPSCPQAQAAIGMPLDIRGMPSAAASVQHVDQARLAALRAETPCWDLDHVAARLLWSQDRAAGAAALVALRDIDPTPVRGTSETNRAITRVGARRGAVVVDTAAAFQARGGGVEPEGWFMDQLHFNEAGDQALAASLAPAVAHALGRPDPGLAWPSP